MPDENAIYDWFSRPFPPENDCFVAANDSRESGNRIEADRFTVERSRKRRAPNWDWGAEVAVLSRLLSQLHSTLMFTQAAVSDTERFHTTQFHRVLPGPEPGLCG